MRDFYVAKGNTFIYTRHKLVSFLGESRFGWLYTRFSEPVLFVSIVPREKIPINEIRYKFTSNLFLPFELVS